MLPWTTVRQRQHVYPNMNEKRDSLYFAVAAYYDYIADTCLQENSTLEKFVTVMGLG